MTVALFDLDRTLVRKDTAGLFIRYEHRHGLTSSARVARVAWWRLLYTAGLVSGVSVARQVLGWYRGREVEELRRHTERWFRQDVVPLITERGRRVVAEHRARGDLLVIVTASTQFVAEQVSRELDIEHVICTELGIAHGVLTGELSGPLCYGPGKLDKVRAFMAPRAEELTKATLYTDSVTDLPLLEAVGHPIAVNPDFRLRAIARQRAWPIQNW